MVKNPPVNATDLEMQVQSLGQEDPLVKAIATHSSILAWTIPWTEEPGRLQSMGLQRVRHNWSDFVQACTSLLGCAQWATIQRKWSLDILSTSPLLFRILWSTKLILGNNFYQVIFWHTDINADADGGTCYPGDVYWFQDTLLATYRIWSHLISSALLSWWSHIFFEETESQRG